MLPMRCIQPPCRNIDVNTVATGGTIASSGGRRAPSNNTAGMTPSANTATWASRGPSEVCHRNASTQAPMSTQLTTGVIELGLSSRSGIKGNDVR